MLLKLILLSFIYQTFAATKPCAHTSTSFQCVKHERTYDGDTFTVTIPNIHPLIGKKVNIRVAGVDTPEIRTKNACEKRKGRRAKRLVENLLSRASRIDLTNIERDKYFRIVADVSIDGASLKSYILKNNLGVSYDGGAKSQIDWCKPLRTISSKK